MWSQCEAWNPADKVDVHINYEKGEKGHVCNSDCGLGWF